MIVIIDYDMGNLGSILNMLKRIGAQAIISSAIKDLEIADKLILPGVGAFDTGMSNLQEGGFLPVLQERVLNDKIPILGICLGIQLFTRRSEEGDLPGLGWVAGETIRFRFSADQDSLKIPHMGWNLIKPVRSHPLVRGLEEEAAFYFVHSYHVVCEDPADVLATTHHGFEFVSALQRGNIMGTQFHPEKSHRYGLTLLRNFAEL